MNIKDLNHKKITVIGPNYVIWDTLTEWRLIDRKDCGNYSVTHAGDGFGWSIMTDWCVLAYGFSDKWKAQRYLLNYDWGK